VKVLITGGAGFVGSNLVEFFVDGDYSSKISEIRVLDKLTYAGSKSNLDSITCFGEVQFIEGDICDLEIVKKAASGVDWILNLAAESHVDRSVITPDIFFTTNILGTQNLLEVALRSNVQRFVQVSTDEVYGSISIGSFDERSQLFPSSPYSASKASADLIALSYFKTFGLNVCITRASNNFGKKQHPEKLIPQSVINLISGNKIKLYGNGLNVRDWLHVKDHCKGIALAAEYGRAGEIYNLGGDFELTNLDLSRDILNFLGLDEDWIEFVADRPGHDFRYSIDSSKAKKELMYEPKNSFFEVLHETIVWYRNNQDWWKNLED
jgi:dTDP-glucose 4,6-dehydratase